MVAETTMDLIDLAERPLVRVTTIEGCDRIDFEYQVNQEIEFSNEMGRTITDVRITPFVTPDATCYFAAIHFIPAEGEAGE
jgi:hypothetical protein